MARPPKPSKQIDALKHNEATRRNIPTAEMESFFRREEDLAPRPPKHYPRARPLPEGERRTKDEPAQPELIWNGARITITEAQMKELAETGTLALSDAQLVWRGKDRQDWSDLVVNVPPLYIQEKIHPQAIIADLMRRRAGRREARADTPDLFADFNGIEPDQRAEFYQHDQHWSNRMILGDSLQVMASLAERESLKGKVQCIYFDPPYGIKFNSNWQVSTQSRDVKDGKQTDISREPEQVRAFRDAWKDGVHSYLAYLRDRLTAMRDLLTQSGSIFVQIGDENVHRVRSVLDEVFGKENFVSQISFTKTSGQTKTNYLPSASDFILHFARSYKDLKYRQPFLPKTLGGEGSVEHRIVELPGLVRRDENITSAELSDNSLLPDGARVYATGPIVSAGGSEAGSANISVLALGQRFVLKCGTRRHWSVGVEGTKKLWKIGRLQLQEGLRIFKRYFDDFPFTPMTNIWTDTRGASDMIFVVQTSTTIVQRCLLMATDPGDLVLDPTCGSGTTAYVAEQWGRRWITVDTSRVALALARARIMGARYPWYILADSPEGRQREAEITRTVPAYTPTHNDIRQGFVYERAPHITLQTIASNDEIDVIWEAHQPAVEAAARALNTSLANHPSAFTIEIGARCGQSINFCATEMVTLPSGEFAPVGGLMEWEVPRDAPASWPASARAALAAFWQARIARQKEIDASIAAHAEVEYLYDKPFADDARVRVAGPFTVESLSPHRVLPASEEELIKEIDAAAGRRSPTEADLAGQDFAAIVLDYLRAEGVRQQAKDDRIAFESLAPWPGNFIGACGTFVEGEHGPERRAAILIGPEYGTVGRQDLVAAAREAVDNRFDVLIACAFNFDAHSSELGSLGSLRILKARINPDMHMSAELKNTGRGNMFVVFGEPDVDIIDDGSPEIRVKVNGVDVFDPNTGAIRSNDTAGIAAWFIDTDYDEESFFVRHAYFLGANDPYKSLKTALQAEIDEHAWATLYADTSRPFARPETGRIAVKVINHHGDEVMKVFRV